MKCISVAF